MTEGKALFGQAELKLRVFPLFIGLSYKCMDSEAECGGGVVMRSFAVAEESNCRLRLRRRGAPTALGVRRARMINTNWLVDHHQENSHSS